MFELNDYKTYQFFKEYVDLEKEVNEEIFKSFAIPSLTFDVIIKNNGKVFLKDNERIEVIDGKFLIHNRNGANK